MGMIERVLSFVFGGGQGGQGGLAQTIEVFRENAERAAERDHAARAASLEQFASEFVHPRKSAFDRVIDGLNRIPRPAMALGTLALFVAAMWDPIGFAARMEGVAVVPEPMWWLLGAIVSFYFGARHQLKGQEFQKSLAQSAAVARALREMPVEDVTSDAPADTPQVSPTSAPPSAKSFPENAALEDWRRSRGG
ncbi:MAG: holin family protein [Pseudomonadota bacterium]